MSNATQPPQDTPDERWLPVVDYEGFYWISDLGRVWSGHGRGRILRPAPDRHGYLGVGIYRNGRNHTRMLHHLVTEAFIGPRPAGLERLHRDGDSKNNRLLNLRYGTRSANMFDSVIHGTHHESRRTHCKNGHAYSAENTYKWSGHRKCRTCERVREQARDRSSRVRVR